MKNKTVEELADEYEKEHTGWYDLTTSAFISGFSARKDLEQKILTDTLNKYRSNLAEEQTPKLGKTANYEKEISYKAYIKILEELKNRLK